MKNELIFLKEPQLIFGYNQRLEEPKDGLTLYGPYETHISHTMQVGVIGTEQGLTNYGTFVERLNKPIFSEDHRKRPSYPGFGAVFGVTWSNKPTFQCVLDEKEIDRLLEMDNLHERTYRLVNLYLEHISKVYKEEEVKLDLWFIVVPKKIWLKCRPKSTSNDETIPSIEDIKAVRNGQTVLFSDMQAEYKEYARMIDTSSDFHNQLKARLLQENIVIPVQIILEPTLCFKDKYRELEYNEKMKSHLAWTQSATVYYKLGKLPWKLSNIRKGVCYLGLVFKKYESGIKADRGYACSAAQMFLDSGDGTIFRGNVGPWKSRDREEYHLDENSSYDLLTMALKSYYEKNNCYPSEVFVHGRSYFWNKEWTGFNRAVSDISPNSKLTGVVIKSSDKIKLFRDVIEEKCEYGILRGLALEISEKEGFLWTRGFVPRLNTSTSLEIPNPLRIVIDKGESNLQQVMEDILCLTKLNYNACIYGDGLPVTLRFSDMIGSILTAVDQVSNRVLPFKYYI